MPACAGPEADCASRQAVLLQPTVKQEPKREGSCSAGDVPAEPSVPTKSDAAQSARVWALLNGDTAARRCAQHLSTLHVLCWQCAVAGRCESGRLACSLDTAHAV